jgi:hypothetical protein
MKTLTPFRKAKIQKQNEIAMIYNKIHSVKRTKHPIPKKEPLVLPEDFTGKDVKRYKKLLKGRKKK